MVMTSFHFDPLLKIRPNSETSDFLLIAIWHGFYPIGLLVTQQETKI